MKPFIIEQVYNYWRRETLPRTTKKRLFDKELTWEEKNPVSYIFRPSKVFKNLQKRENKKDISTSK